VIRYQISRTELEELISAAVPSWLARASQRTGQFEVVGQYNEASGIWGEIKTVYMEIQHNKCAYCERELEDKEHGKIEHDLEHYRPKSNVRCWPTAQIRRAHGIQYDFPTGAARPGGYYWLAYDILNYATACKSCNSSLKRDYFPIAGDRAPDLAENQALAAELPLLLYPISDVDDDPESVFTFAGIIPVSRDGDDHRRKRARVTIDFFRLDSREHLRRDRVRQIVTVYFALMTLGNDAAEQTHKDFMAQVLANAVAPDAPHSSCARAFRDIHAQDRAKADELARLATDYLTKGRS
jgi:hypothetical protein